LVFDNSASMQTLEKDRTRFALAQDHAQDILSEVSASASVDLYLTVPSLTKIRPEPFSTQEAARAVRTLAPYDLAEPSTDYSTLLGTLSGEQYDRVYFITDHPSRGASGAIRVVTVGEPKGNLAISSFGLSRSSLVSSRLQAQIEITNFSTKDERVTVGLKGSGNRLASRDVVVPASRSVQTNFEGFSSNPFYEAEIVSRDALPLDNRRFAVPPPSQNLRILGISPRAQALASLRSIPGVTIDTIVPQDYARTDRSAYSLEIFHYSAPAVLPHKPALFVLPPQGNALVEVAAPVARAVVSSWREAHPLSRYVNFSLFRPSYAQSLKPQTAGEVIIESPEGPLAFAVERPDNRYLVLGFDPFPYLGRDNLPVSIFTLNFLDWFFAGARGTTKATGDPIVLGTSRSGDLLVTPNGQRLSLDSGTSVFRATHHQGIYQVRRGNTIDYLAVNLQHGSESDLRDAVPIVVSGIRSEQSGLSTLHSFWLHILLAALVVLFLEWFLSRSRIRRPLATAR
jgi:hypothetical protein